jgi:hypothetical protein
MNTLFSKTALACGVLLAGLTAAQAQTLGFNTLAGNAGHGSADGNSSSAQFNSPGSVALDSAGNLYVADTDNHVIRKITSAGTVSTLAGVAGVSGSSDGTGSSARFNQPLGIAVDSAGDLYVADTGNYTIRKLTLSGGNWVVSTLAGQAGVSGSSNGNGTNALFYQPEGIAVDNLTNVYVADTWNHTIRLITSAGTVSTLAGTPGSFGSTDGPAGSALFYQPQGLAVDSAQNVYVADTANHTIRKITSGGSVSTLAGFAGRYGFADGNGTNAQFYQPEGVALDGSGNLYVAECFNSTLRMVTPAGVVTTVAGSAVKYGSTDGSGSGARFWGPQGVAAAGTNLVTVYVADTGNGSVRRISGVGSAWAVSTLAGSASAGSADGVGSSARFYGPGSIGRGTTGFYLADSQNNTIRQMSLGGVVSTFAGSAQTNGSTDGGAGDARFWGPRGVAADSAGNLYVADSMNGTVRKITPYGLVRTLAGSAGIFGSADGNGSSAQFYRPSGVAVDGNGNVYVSDSISHTIRKITSAGVVSTLAGLSGSAGGADGMNSVARFNGPSGLATDSSGNLYVCDTLNHTIRLVTPSGAVSTLAGLAGLWGSADGSNSDARFFEPSGVAVDGAGNVFVLDSGNHTVRMLVPSGTNWVVTTVAGLPGVSGSSAGLGSDARFYYPAGLTISADGLLVLADTGNNTISVGGAVIGAAPTILIQPQDQSTVFGGSATFTVLASGTMPLSYQWSFNSAPIIGATGSSYTRSNMQSNDLGSYSVFITNMIDHVTSSNALLTLSVPPVITAQPQSQSVFAGDSVTFSVTVTGSAPLSYQWLWNGVGIEGAVAPVLVLPSASHTNAGFYSVVVTNPAGIAASANAELIVTELEAWGDNTLGQINVPLTSRDAIAVASGAWHNLALRSDGSVVAWGDDSAGQSTVPTNLTGVLSIAAGGYHSLALTADGTVTGWGGNDSGQITPPAGLANVIAISAGTWHSLALRRDGTVVGWGDNSWGQATPPPSLNNVVAIAAGGNHSLALKADGTVVGWGENTDSQGHPAGQAVPPLGLTNATRIAAGKYHSLALKADGTVVAWGSDSEGQCDYPAGVTNFVALAGGGAHSLALRADGTVMAWGADWNGQCEVALAPSNVVAIGAGESHSVALAEGRLPVPLMLKPALKHGQFSSLVQTLNRRQYILEQSGSLPTVGWSPICTNSGNGVLELLTDPTATAPQGYYRVRQY